MQSRLFLNIFLGLGGLAVVVGALALFVLFRLNAFESYASDYKGVCTPVVGVPGVEDIAADESRSIAWLSSLDRLALRSGDRGPDNPVRGAIVAFDPDNPLDNGSWQDRTGGVPEQFEPLGIDLYEAAGVSRLFVINRAGASSVLIYDITPQGDLNLIKTVSYRWMNSPNSIVAVGPTAFYVSNSTRAKSSSLTARLGFMFGRGSGNIFYYDGNSWNTAADHLRYANGLALSEDGTWLYLAETSGKQISLFKRTLATGVLTGEMTVALDSFPDNLYRRADGSLLVGAIPKPLALAGLFEDTEAISPSQIIRIQIDSSGSVVQDMFYQNDGTELSGGTVAVDLGPKLLIGTIAENKFLLCDQARLP